MAIRQEPSWQEGRGLRRRRRGGRAGQGSVSRRISFPGSFRKDHVCRGQRKLACAASGGGQCEAGPAFEEDAAGTREAANRRLTERLLKQEWWLAVRRRNCRREIPARVVFLSSALLPGAELRG